MNRIEVIDYRVAKAEDSTHMMKLVKQLGYCMKLDDLEENLENILSDEKYYMYVAVNQIGEVVGYAHAGESSLLYKKYRAELYELCVHEDYRGHRIGRELLKEVERWAKVKGCCEVVLKSHEIRGRAHSFYEKVGYRKIKKQYVMIKKLG